jgi:hypothetical protein
MNLIGLWHVRRRPANRICPAPKRQLFGQQYVSEIGTIPQMAKPTGRNIAAGRLAILAWHHWLLSQQVHRRRRMAL